MHSKKKVLLLFKIFIFYFLVALHLSAQGDNPEMWTGYIAHTRIKENIYVMTDFHWATQAFALARMGLTYRLNNGTRVTLGYAYVKTATPQTQDLVRGENRYWGQVVQSFPLSDKFKYIFRFRYDARFREALDEEGGVSNEGNVLSHRYRVMQNLRWNIKQTSGNSFLHLDLINETLLNSGQNIHHPLDQVRNYLMLGYTHSNMTFLAGYHQRWIPRLNNSWNLRQGVTVWMVHNINFKKKGLPSKEDNTVILH